MQHSSSKLTISISEEPYKTLKKQLSFPTNLKAQLSPKHKIAAAQLFEHHSPYGSSSAQKTKRRSSESTMPESASPLSSNPSKKSPSTHLKNHKKRNTEYNLSNPSQDFSTPKVRKQSHLRNLTFKDPRQPNLSLRDNTITSFNSLLLASSINSSSKSKISVPELEQIIAVKLSRCQDIESRFKVFQELFDVLISQDEEYSSLLKRIKLEYEEQLERLKQYKQVHKYSPQDSDLYIYREKIESLSKENLRISLLIEQQAKEIQEWKVRMTESPWVHLMQENQNLAHKLEALEKQFKVDESGAVTETFDFNSPREIPNCGKILGKIPKLNLNSDYIKGFHDEFLENFQEFSTSWRDAMKVGR